MQGQAWRASPQRGVRGPHWARGLPRFPRAVRRLHSHSRLRSPGLASHPAPANLGDPPAKLVRGGPSRQGNGQEHTSLRAQNLTVGGGRGRGLPGRTPLGLVPRAPSEPLHRVSVTKTCVCTGASCGQAWEAPASEATRSTGETAGVHPRCSIQNGNQATAPGSSPQGETRRRKREHPKRKAGQPARLGGSTTPGDLCDRQVQAPRRSPRRTLASTGPRATVGRSAHTGRAGGRGPAAALRGLCSSPAPGAPRHRHGSLQPPLPGPTRRGARQPQFLP